MDKKVMDYLRGFYSYERSFNKLVIADDTDMQKAYEKAQERGTLPFNRTKILILGDHAAGKTSTCRRLQGKDFRREEPSTIGIETNTVKAKVSDVNSKWCGVSNTPQEDYESSAAWWAVSHVHQHGRNKTRSRSGASTEPDVGTQMSMGQLIEDVFYQIMQNLPILITFLFGGFTFGFGLVVWIYIICLTSIFDVHSAYRFGSGYTIALVLIDSAMSVNEHYIDVEHGTEMDVWTDMCATMTVCMYGVIGLITGVLIGGGGRTGICVAFSTMVHPRQKRFTIANFTEKIIIIYNRAYFKLLICIFAIIIILLYRHLHAQIYAMSRRKYIGLLIGIVLFLNVAMFMGSKHFLGVFTSASVVVIVCCSASGVLVGRKCVAYGYVPKTYMIKKSIGFIAGLFIAFICGWELVDFRTNYNGYLSILSYTCNLFFFVSPIIAFILYECFAYMKVKNTSSIPITHIRESMKANIRNELYLDARLSLWDFAGQDMYYNTHHLFMPKQAVYLIVFNAVEAVFNPEKQIKRLQFWLQSVAMHAEVENVVVLLVGTRRQHIKDTEGLLNFIRRANAHLYKRFSKLLAFHPSKSLFFFVENSLKVDNELNILREVIYNEVRKLDFFQKKFSIKYLLFNETLNTFRQKKCIITSLKEIKFKCNISQNELRQLLKFFDRSGDVIYNDHDELLRNYVICNPQLLVDFLECLVNVPEPHNRKRKVSDLWQKLKDKGIVDSELLAYICDVQEIWPMYPYIISFLVGTHLLFPLSVTNTVQPVGEFFLGCRLPKITSMSEIWNSQDYSQDTFYFDFGEILTECIFLRLIAKCCEAFIWDKIYYNAARFRSSKSCLFLIMTDTISGNVDSYERNLIKVAIHNDDQSQVLHVLQTIITLIEEIINRDFNPDYFREHYICGPECERCSYLDETMSLVNIITPGTDVSALDGYRPDHYHKISFEPKVLVDERF